MYEKKSILCATHVCFCDVLKPLRRKCFCSSKKSFESYEFSIILELLWWENVWNKKFHSTCIVVEGCVLIYLYIFVVFRYMCLIKSKKCWMQTSQMIMISLNHWRGFQKHLQRRRGNWFNLPMCAVKVVQSLVYKDS